MLRTVNKFMNKYIQLWNNVDNLCENQTEVKKQGFVGNVVYPTKPCFAIYKVSI